MERRTFLTTALAAVPGLAIDFGRLQFPQGSPPVSRAEDAAGMGRWEPTPVGGTFTISVCGRTTGPLAYDSTQADVDRAMARTFPEGVPPWLKILAGVPAGFIVSPES